MNGSFSNSTSDLDHPTPRSTPGQDAGDLLALWYALQWRFSGKTPKFVPGRSGSAGIVGFGPSCLAMLIVVKPGPPRNGQPG